MSAGTRVHMKSWGRHRLMLDHPSLFFFFILWGTVSQSKSELINAAVLALLWQSKTVVTGEPACLLIMVFIWVLGSRHWSSHLPGKCFNQNHRLRVWEFKIKTVLHSRMVLEKKGNPGFASDLVLSGTAGAPGTLQLVICCGLWGLGSLRDLRGWTWKVQLREQGNVPETLGTCQGNQISWDQVEEWWLSGGSGFRDQGEQYLALTRATVTASADMKQRWGEKSIYRGARHSWLYSKNRDSGSGEAKLSRKKSALWWLRLQQSPPFLLEEGVLGAWALSPAGYSGVGVGAPQVGALMDKGMLGTTVGKVARRFSCLLVTMQIMQMSTRLLESNFPILI